MVNNNNNSNSNSNTNNNNKQCQSMPIVRKKIISTARCFFRTNKP